MGEYKIIMENTAKANGVSKCTRIISEELSPTLVLDYGCGKLRNTKHLISKNFSVDLIDSEKQLELNKKEIEKLNLKKFSIDEVEMINSKYDVILCSYVLNVIDIYDIRVTVIENIEKLLKENGLAYIEVRGKGSLKDVKHKEVLNDGFIVGSGRSRTFQKEFSEEDITEFIKKNTSLEIVKVMKYSNNLGVIIKKRVII